MYTIGSGTLSFNSNYILGSAFSGTLPIVIPQSAREDLLEEYINTKKRLEDLERRIKNESGATEPDGFLLGGNL